jgi:3'-5' exoribonuclease 1
MIQETIEIGAFKVNEYAEVTGRFSKFVKPVINPTLSPFCKKLTSITQEEVNSASTFPRVIKEFVDWAEIYDEEHVLCSWGSFDQKQFFRECAIYKIEDDWVENHINIKRQYQEVRRLHQTPGLRRAVLNEGFEWTGIAHRGIDDAHNLVKIVRKYIDMWRV